MCNGTSIFLMRASNMKRRSLSYGSYFRLWSEPILLSSTQLQLFSNDKLKSLSKSFLINRITNYSSWNSSQVAETSIQLRKANSQLSSATHLRSTMTRPSAKSWLHDVRCRVSSPAQRKRNIEKAWEQENAENQRQATSPSRLLAPPRIRLPALNKSQPAFLHLFQLRQGRQCSTWRLRVTVTWAWTAAPPVSFPAMSIKTSDWRTFRSRTEAAIDANRLSIDTWFGVASAVRGSGASQAVAQQMGDEHRLSRHRVPRSRSSPVLATARRAVVEAAHVANLSSILLFGLEQAAHGPATEVSGVLVVPDTRESGGNRATPASSRHRFPSRCGAEGGLPIILTRQHMSASHHHTFLW